MKTKILLIISVISTMLFSSCSKDNENRVNLITKELYLKSGQIDKIAIEPNSANCKFTSDNSYIASVNSYGEVKGLIIGETFINVSNIELNLNNKCKVVVSPQYQIYKEPYLKFGATQSEVKSNETRDILLSDLSAISYKGENSKIDLIIYTFKDGKLNSTAVLIPSSSSNVELLVNFLNERYIVDKTGENIVFLKIDKTIAGTISEQYYGGKYYYMVVYFPYQSSKSSSITFIEYKNNVINKLKN